MTELHKSGYPHYHLLVRSSFIPQKELSGKWAELTGSPIVDVRKILDNFSSFRYLVKYLTKLHKIEWTDRHVSYSRNFFAEEDKEKIAFPERDILSRSDEHPWQYLGNRYPSDQVGMIDENNYVLPYVFKGVPFDMARTEFGLPACPASSWPRRKSPLPFSPLKSNSKPSLLKGSKLITTHRDFSGTS